jgi:hypothetical protein
MDITGVGIIATGVGIIVTGAGVTGIGVGVTGTGAAVTGKGRSRYNANWDRFGMRERAGVPALLSVQFSYRRNLLRSGHNGLAGGRADVAKQKPRASGVFAWHQCCAQIGRQRP